MSKQAAAHRFAGMDSERNVPPLPGTDGYYFRYRGLCACGHEDPWTVDKEAAWEAIADHYLPVIRRFLDSSRLSVGVCAWCEYGRCAECLALGLLCGCRHPGLT